MSRRRGNSQTRGNSPSQPVHVLRLDEALHDLDLARTQAYPIIPTLSAIAAVAWLEGRLTDNLDPLTMASSPIRPKIWSLGRHLDDQSLWFVCFTYGSMPGLAGRTRYREIDRPSWLAIAQ